MQGSHKTVTFHLFREKTPLYQLKPKFAQGDSTHVQCFKTKFSGITILQGVKLFIFQLIFAKPITAYCYQPVVFVVIIIIIIITNKHHYRAMSYKQTSRALVIITV